MPGPADRHPGRIRTAVPGDLAAIRQLDGLADTDPYFEPAPAGELEAAVCAEDVLVAVSGGDVVGYIHVNSQRPDLYYLSGFAVFPHMRGHGIGRRLLGAALASLSVPDRPVYTMTSPANLATLHLLLDHRFVGRWPLPDHFGSGLHRVGLQLLSTAAPGTRRASSWRGGSDLRTWLDIAATDHVVVALRRTGSRTWLGCLPSAALGWVPGPCPALTGTDGGPAGPGTARHSSSLPT